MGGAICGQIAGAFYGIDAIDERLRQRLEQWDAGETALRGALLMALGSSRTAEQNSQTRRSLEEIAAQAVESVTVSEGVDAEEIAGHGGECVTVSDSAEA